MKTPFLSNLPRFVQLSEERTQAALQRAGAAAAETQSSLEEQLAAALALVDTQGQ